MVESSIIDTRRSALSITLVLVPVAIAVASAIATRKESRDDPGSFRLGTRMKDEKLLKAALENYGSRTIVTSESIDSTIDDTRILFERNEQDAFEAVFVGDISIDHAETFLAQLDEEYTRLVQQQVYENLLSRARQRGLVMESEEVQNDNSVVITFRV